MRAGLVFVALLVLGLPGVVSSACESKQVIDVTRDSVVKVETPDGVQQSGVVVAQDLVVTVWHGLERSAAPRVHVDGGWQVASVLLYDVETDLALLKVATRAVSPLTLLNRVLLEGEPVWVFGWPADRYQTVGEGIYLGGWKGSLRVTSLVQAGQSGGALIACQGGRVLLAGLVTGFGAREVDGSLVREPNMTLAVPADRLLEFFEHLPSANFARKS